MTEQNSNFKFDLKSELRACARSGGRPEARGGRAISRCARRTRRTVTSVATGEFTQPTIHRDRAASAAARREQKRGVLLNGSVERKSEENVARPGDTRWHGGARRVARSARRDRRRRRHSEHQVVPRRQRDRRGVRRAIRQLFQSQRHRPLGDTEGDE